MGKSLAPAVQFPLRSSDLAFPVSLTARNDLETVRYYERRSLLPKAPRSPSGYRLFAIEAAQRIRFIQRARRVEMEATIFAGWIYDLPHAEQVKVAHQLLLRAIAAAI